MCPVKPPAGLCNEMSGIGENGTCPRGAIECNVPNNLRMEEFTHN